MDGYKAEALACESEKIGEIEHLDFVTVRLPFLHPFSISKATWTCKEALLVRLEDEGVVAWGECVADPDPYYAYETTSTCAHIIEGFLWPCVEPGITLGELFERWKLVRGHGMAKAALENALLDLLAKRKGQPLYKELGLTRRRVMSGVSLGIQESKEALVAAAAEAVDSGYHRVKMKVKRGKDVEYARAVRERFPSLKLMVDANGDYSLADAEHLAELDELGLMMIEQPLSYSDIYQHSKLQRKLRTPICLDESILSLDDAVAAVELDAARIINIKQGRVGGLVEAIKIARYAASKGIPVWSGGMDETGIGRAVNIHLQADSGFVLPGDTAETKRYFPEDLVSPPVKLAEGGFIEIPEGPGIGVEVLPDRLDRLTIARRRIK
jgi:O-succinylbenzoate synthase